MNLKLDYRMAAPQCGVCGNEGPLFHTFVGKNPSQTCRGCTDKLQGDEARPADSLTPQEMTVNLVAYAVSKRHSGGLGGVQRRMWARLHRRLTEAAENDSETVELEKAEIDFLLDAVKDQKFPAADSFSVVVLEDELERVNALPGEAKAV